jgi:hypothetical protein
MTPRGWCFTLPQNPANFHTENTVGLIVHTETIGMRVVGYARGLYAGIEDNPIVQNNIKRSEHGASRLDGYRPLSVRYIPLNGLTQSLLQGCLGTKPECLPCPGRIEAASRLTIRATGIPREVAVKVG